MKTRVIKISCDWKVYTITIERSDGSSRVYKGTGDIMPLQRAMNTIGGALDFKNEQDTLDYIAWTRLELGDWIRSYRYGWISGEVSGIIHKENTIEYYLYAAGRGLCKIDVHDVVLIKKGVA